jgi:fatty acid desaturase
MSTETPKGEEFRVKDRRGLPIAKVRELSALSPGRATLSLIETWGALGVCVGAALAFPRLGVIVLAILGVAAGQHGLAILAHQSAHYRMFERRWLNDLVGKLCGLPLGVSLVTYRMIHRIHHNHLYSPIDPDLALMAGYPRGRAYLVKKLLKDLLGLTTVKNYLYFMGRSPTTTPTPTTTRAADVLDDTSPALRASARRDRHLVTGVHLTLLAVAIVTGVWRWYLLLWLLPLVTVTQALLRLRAVCEHGAPRDTSTPYRAARTTLAPAVVRWFVFPHQMHFHVEHHLYPSVPHYRLHECHAALREAGLLDDAEVVPTFRQTLAKIFAEPTASPGSGA